MAIILKKKPKKSRAGTSDDSPAVPRRDELPFPRGPNTSPCPCRTPALLSGMKKLRRNRGRRLRNRGSSRPRQRIQRKGARAVVPENPLTKGKAFWKVLEPTDDRARKRIGEEGKREKTLDKLRRRIRAKSFGKKDAAPRRGTQPRKTSVRVNQCGKWEQDLKKEGKRNRTRQKRDEGNRKDIRAKRRDCVPLLGMKRRAKDTSMGIGGAGRGTRRTLKGGNQGRREG